MPTPNPLKSTGPASFVSEKTFHIAGILTTVYGLQEVTTSCTSISCLWLLHPRLQTKEMMRYIASRCIQEWNQQAGSNRTIGLIAVAFDQRNHGSREVNALANESWKDGNETHAQDMFSIFNGTAMDTSLLIDHLPSYIFNTKDSPLIEQHLVLGISLGGHSAWQVLLSDSRVTAGVVIIGCPDYMRVMTDRARLSKLQTYTSTQGADFHGSKDFPLALMSSLKKWDPKGIIFGTSEIEDTPTLAMQELYTPILDQKIKGKRILVCSGANDRLVPYHCSKPFMQFLKNATSGWYKGGNVYVEDNVYPGVGHAFSDGMVKDTIRFVNDTLVAKSGGGVSDLSKI
ncbi:hypothetical protein SBOR_3121 [Sclerotinia borealis F-4128]|uniref:AB hydrolase-1 domain-containing protein n=1 Tax=Sclerotinia borealis (strain F-4128) TaxID=1432307 RepID=W9CPE4_SCLBF|nr:hypothetical protein SBOR_3121 [Sclerotinia borealis F-4128]